MHCIPFLSHKTVLYNSKYYCKRHECKFYDFQSIYSGHKEIDSKIVLFIFFLSPSLVRVREMVKKVNKLVCHECAFVFYYFRFMSLSVYRILHAFITRSLYTFVLI